MALFVSGERRVRSASSLKARPRPPASSNRSAIARDEFGSSLKIRPRPPNQLEPFVRLLTFSVAAELS